MLATVGEGSGKILTFWGLLCTDENLAAQLSALHHHQNAFFGAGFRPAISAWKTVLTVTNGEF